MFIENFKRAFYKICLRQVQVEKEEGSATLFQMGICNTYIDKNKIIKSVNQIKRRNI